MRNEDELMNYAIKQEEICRMTAFQINCLKNMV